MPNAKMSDRVSAWPPRSCSGAMYPGVPTGAAGSVSGPNVAASSRGPAGPSTTLASPKSITLTCPCSVSMMFAGLRSRCTSRCACAVSSASAISPAISMARCAETAPRASDACSVSPETCSMTMPVPVDLRDLVNLADVGVVERRRRARLAVQPLARGGVGLQRLGDELDGDLAAELGVVGQKHLTHAALAQAGEEVVAGCGVVHRLHAEGSPWPRWCGAGLQAFDARRQPCGTQRRATEGRSMPPTRRPRYRTAPWRRGPRLCWRVPRPRAAPAPVRPGPSRSRVPRWRVRPRRIGPRVAPARGWGPVVGSGLRSRWRYDTRSKRIPPNAR